MKGLSIPVAALILSSLFGLVSASASEQFHARNGYAGRSAVLRHRRHHQAIRSAQAVSDVRRARKRSNCKAKTKASSTASASTSSATTASSGNSTSSSSSSSPASSNCPTGSISVNGVCVGMLPDGGSDGGSQDTMSKLNTLVSSTNKVHAYFGQYAQATGSNWGGGQLTQVMADLKASGAIFQPAVMPTGGWSGLTSSDNSLAVDICTVMKQFTDEGIEVWLRFAHEVNWYQTDGTYQGTASDFKEGWATVAAACKSVAPDVKMFFTPNVADLSTYEEYYPDDPTTVDIIGVDFYPNQGSDLDSAFTTAMQGFHDKYCSDSGPIFAIGETGLGYAGSASDKVQWINAIAQSKSSMPYMTGVSWFNYEKGYNFKIADPNDSTTTAAYISWAQGN